MSIFDAAAVMRRAWWFVAIFVVLGAVAGVGISRMAPPMYTSRSQMFLATRSDASAAELAAGSNYMKLQIGSYPSLITSQTVLNPVIKKLNLHTSAAALANDVVVDVPTNQMWLIVTVRSSNAHQAQQISGAISSESKAAISRLEARGASKSPVTVTIVSKGSAPIPVPRKATIYTAGGVLLGLIFAVALVMARWALRDARRRSIESAPSPSVSVKHDEPSPLDPVRAGHGTQVAADKATSGDEVVPEIDETGDRVVLSAHISGAPWNP